ncbi:hypothetical protein FRC01_006807, partial [Tulasnella sp. 417]
MDSTLASAHALLSQHAILTNQVRSMQREHRHRLAQLHSPPNSLLSLPLLPSPPLSPPTSPPTQKRSVFQQPQQPARPIPRPDLPPAKQAKMARYPNYVPEEETIRNDYSQRYVDAGEWPQNWVQGAEPERRFEEYPKQQRLLGLKKASVAAVANPPMHIPLSSITALATSTPAVPKFDAILIDPPYSSSFSWDELENIPIPTLAADPSFVFLWVGSGAGEGLEKGRALLAKWGYRRCEDVVWIKTNNESNRGPGVNLRAILVPADRPANHVSINTDKATLPHGYTRDCAKERLDAEYAERPPNNAPCLDTDVIIWEGDPSDPTRKPPEMYTLIENFCLGLRRLEIFGRPYSLRPGWVTCGDFELTPDLIDETGARDWDQTVFESELPRDGLGRAVVPMSQEIDILRPKSPNRPGHASQGSQGGSVGSIPPQYTGGQQAGNMAMGGGGGGGGGLPPRPMNMNQPNARNPGGAFSGGVGLGIRPQQPQQPMPPHMGYGGMPGMAPMMNQQGMMGGAGPGGAFGGMGAGRGMMPPNMAQMQGM